MKFIISENMALSPDPINAKSSNEQKDGSGRVRSAGIKRETDEADLSTNVSSGTTVNVPSAEFNDVFSVKPNMGILHGGEFKLVMVNLFILK